MLAPLPAAAQTPDGVGVLDLALSPTEITVGDRIEARLTLVWTGPPPAAAPRFPAWQETWGDAEVLAAGEVRSVAGPGARRVYRQALVLTAFTTGDIRLPEITVAVARDGETIEITGGGDAGFEVRSVLPEEQRELEPRPPAPPRPLAGDALFAWTASGLGGLCLLAAWLLGRRLRVPVAGALPRARIGPLAELLDRLHRLDPTAAEPAHTGLSQGLRQFLGDSLGFPAAESTTTEIERRLRQARIGPDAAGDDPAQSALRADVVLLLRDCDQAKFARLPVAAPITRGRLRQARDLGTKIDRACRPAPDEAVR